MLLELAVVLFVQSIFIVLSTTAAIFGVSHALSTEKQKALKTVDKPVEKPRRLECVVCGAHVFREVKR